MTTERRLVNDLPNILGELATGPYPEYIDDVLAVTARMSQRPVWTFIPMLSAIDARGRMPYWRTRLLAVALLAAILAVIVAAALVVGSRLPAEPQIGVVSNGWIAYSTSGPSPGSTDATTGSDMYLVREGIEPTLIAGRAGGTKRNVCPAFSPDGHRLAFGVDSTVDGRALLVLGIDVKGVPTNTTRLGVAGPGSTVCPRWSADGRHLAYLDHGVIVLRGLDGAVLSAGPHDPTLDDFGLDRQLNSLPPEVRRFLSPAGDRMAWLSTTGCGVNIARPDGSGVYMIPGACGYALAAWSPDGRQVLVMEDVSGRDFTMHAFTVDAPFETTIVVSTVRTNGARSWPGWNDVSWQPIYR